MLYKIEIAPNSHSIVATEKRRKSLKKSVLEINPLSMSEKKNIPKVEPSAELLTRGQRILLMTIKKRKEAQLKKKV